LSDNSTQFTLKSSKFNAMILTQSYFNELCNFWVMLEAFYARQKCQSTSKTFFLQKRMHVLRAHVLRTDGPLAIARLVSKCPTKTFQASCFKGLVLNSGIKSLFLFVHFLVLTSSKPYYSSTTLVPLPVPMMQFS